MNPDEIRKMEDRAQLIVSRLSTVARGRWLRYWQNEGELLKEKLYVEAVAAEEAAELLRGAMARGWEIRKMEDRAYGLYRVAREIEDALKAAEKE